MENIEKIRTALYNAVVECCKHADCDKMARIFKVADWVWCDMVTNEYYHPEQREIRTTLYKLGHRGIDSLIKGIEEGTLDKTNPRDYTYESGRLFFDIHFEINGEELDVLRDVVMECGIRTEWSRTIFGDVTTEGYVVNTYVDDDDYEEDFDWC